MPTALHYGRTKSPFQQFNYNKPYNRWDEISRANFGALLKRAQNGDKEPHFADFLSPKKSKTTHRLTHFPAADFFEI